MYICTCVYVWISLCVYVSMVYVHLSVIMFLAVVCPGVYVSFLSMFVSVYMSIHVCICTYCIHVAEVYMWCLCMSVLLKMDPRDLTHSRCVFY